MKFSKLGSAVAAIFMLLAIAVFAWLIYSAATNPADSGEGGVFLLFFAMPWINIIPTNYINPFTVTAIACILLNTFLLYCLFGGLRFS